MVADKYITRKEAQQLLIDKIDKIDDSHLDEIINWFMDEEDRYYIMSDDEAKKYSKKNN